MKPSELDAASRPEAAEALRDCCGASSWVEAMLAGRPYGTLEAWLKAAERAWAGLDREDQAEAFAAHPRIGEAKAAREVSSRASAWSAHEQASTDAGDADLAARLEAANRAYEERFGHVFLVFASGRSRAEILELCRQRLGNEPGEEWEIAAAEQARITENRLRRLLS